MPSMLRDMLSGGMVKAGLSNSMVSQGMNNSLVSRGMNNSLVSAGLKDSMLKEGFNQTTTQPGMLSSLGTQAQDRSSNYLSSLEEDKKKLKKLLDSDVFKTLMQTYMN